MAIRQAESLAPFSGVVDAPARILADGHIVHPGEPRLEQRLGGPGLHRRYRLARRRPLARLAQDHVQPPRHRQLVV